MLAATVSVAFFDSIFCGAVGPLSQMIGALFPNGTRAEVF